MFYLELQFNLKVNTKVNFTIFHNAIKVESRLEIQLAKVNSLYDAIFFPIQYHGHQIMLTLKVFQLSTWDIWKEKIYCYNQSGVLLMLNTLLPSAIMTGYSIGQVNAIS